MNINFNHSFKIKGKGVSKYIEKSIDYAHRHLATRKNVLGIINCPINKYHLGKNNFGVTELSLFNLKLKKY